MSFRIRLALAGVFLTLPAPSPHALYAQVQTTNGRIQGEITDRSGAVIVDAAVEADEVETAIVHRAVTDKGGHFEFPSLKPGLYTVKITKDGFTPTIQENLSLTVGLTSTLRLALQVAGTAESVVVTSAPLIDVTTTAFTTTLGEQTVATTPVLGRKFEDLLTLTPGVSISQGPDGDEININGQRVSSIISRSTAAIITMGFSASSPVASALQSTSRWKL